MHKTANVGPVNYVGGCRMVTPERPFADTAVSNPIPERFRGLPLKRTPSGDLYFAENGGPFVSFWEEVLITNGINDFGYVIKLKPPQERAAYPNGPITYAKNPYVLVEFTDGRFKDYIPLPTDYFNEDFERIPTGNDTAKFESRSFKAIWLQYSGLPEVVQEIVSNVPTHGLNSISNVRRDNILTVDDYAKTWPPISGDFLPITTDGRDIHTMGFNDKYETEEFLRKLINQEILTYDPKKNNLLYRIVYFIDDEPILVRLWNDGEIHTVDLRSKRNKVIHLKRPPQKTVEILEDILKSGEIPQEIIPAWELAA